MRSREGQPERPDRPGGGRERGSTGNGWRRDRVRAWAVGAVLVGLLLVLRLHLIAALFSGLLVHELVHALAPHVTPGGMERSSGRWLTVGLIATLVIAALVTVTLLGVAFLRSEIAGPSGLLVRLADIVEQSRASLPWWIRDQLPADPQTMREMLVGWIREHAQEVQQLGRSVGLAVAHVAFGSVIGALICVREARGMPRPTPLVEELETRLRLLARAFRRIVFAQLKISTINTLLTAFYLYSVLPLAGVHLPLRKTTLAVTFLAGLLPIAGNLISNSLIVVVSLSASFATAAVSLVFLILLHKLEYFLNARIVGVEIEASAWELLCAMLVGEAAFGVPGLIAAPVLYAYAKDELKAAGWM